MEKEISRDNPHGRLDGLLLAGGYSTRVGKDKAFIPFKGQPVYLHLAQILASVCTEVKISCRYEQQNLFENYLTITDAMPSSGPVTGLLSAFREDPQTSRLIIAVDMPYLTVEFLRKYLINQREILADATIIFDQKTTTLQPLVGIYEARSYPVILKHFREGQYSLKKILSSLQVHAVNYFDEQNILANLNTLNDWQET